MPDKDEKPPKAKPDMADWDNAPKPEMQYKSLDKKRIVSEKK